MPAGDRDHNTARQGDTLALGHGREDGAASSGVDWDSMLAELATQPVEEGWVTLREASDAAGVSRSTLRSWYRTFQIPSRMVAGTHGPQRMVLLEAVVDPRSPFIVRPRAAGERPVPGGRSRCFASPGRGARAAPRPGLIIGTVVLWGTSWRGGRRRDGSGATRGVSGGDGSVCGKRDQRPGGDEAGRQRVPLGPARPADPPGGGRLARQRVTASVG